jgi:glycerophosphoryl diester phosphodiesterase
MELELPFIIGHRGASGSAPENTRAGAIQARKLGCRWIEIDVQLSADSVPVVIHDHTLERTTNGHGPVAAANAAQLAALDAGRWFAPAFAGEPIPTLAGMMRTCEELNLGLNIELKPSPGTVVQTAKAVAATIERAKQPILVSSFSQVALGAFHAAAPRIPLGALYRTAPQDADLQRQSAPVCTIHVVARALTRSDVARLNAAGFQVLSFVVDETDRAQQVRSWGVAAVFSDYPERFAGLVAA